MATLRDAKLRCHYMAGGRPAHRLTLLRTPRGGAVTRVTTPSPLSLFYRLLCWRLAFACMMNQASRLFLFVSIPFSWHNLRLTAGQAYLRCVCAALNFDVGEIWSWRDDEGAENGERLS